MSETKTEQAADTRETARSREIRVTQTAESVIGTRFFLGALIAVPTTIFSEVALMALPSNEAFFHSWNELAWYFLAAVCLLAPPALLYGLIGGSLWSYLEKRFDLSGRVYWMYQISRWLAGEDQRFGAYLFAGIGGGDTDGPQPVSASTSLQYSLQQQTAGGFCLYAGSLGTCRAGSGAPGAVTGIGSQRRSIFERWLPGRFLQIQILFLSAVLGTSIVTLAWINRSLFTMIDPAPFILLGIFFSTQMLVYLLTGLVPFAQGFRIGAKILGLLLIPLLVGAWMLLIDSWPRFSYAGSMVRHHAGLGKPVLALLHRVTDRDGDGFSAVLGGADCNDSDPTINPLAQEIPGDGLDNDCLGGDAAPVVAQVEETEEEKGGASRIVEMFRDEYNILLIVIDALRADHLGMYGYPRDVSPKLDQWARQSVVFERAYTTAPNTPQAIPALLTGRYPSQIDWSNYHNFPKIDDRTQPMYERLKGDLGYQVNGIFSYWYFNHRNLERGADLWDTTAFRENGHAEANATSHLITNKAIAQLPNWESEAKTRGVFMYLHYFDPHFLYIKHPGVKRYGDSQMDLYDHEIRFSDQEVARFLEAFEKTEMARKTIVVLTADHGEEFEEHGGHYHGSAIYEESVHVPLVIRMPGVSPRRVKTPVSLVDLAPTVFDLVGLPADPRHQGRSLAASIVGGEDPRPVPIFCEKIFSPSFSYTLQSYQDWPWKLIYRTDENLFELYNLRVDPGEKRNLRDRLPEKVRELSLDFSNWKLRHLEASNWQRLARGGQL